MGYGTGNATVKSETSISGTIEAVHQIKTKDKDDAESDQKLKEKVLKQKEGLGVYPEAKGEVKRQKNINFFFWTAIL